MTLDLNKYIVNLAMVERFCRLHPEMSEIEIISRVTIASSMPVIVTAHYVAKYRGMTPAIQDTLVQNMAFYSIDEVVPLKEEAT